MLCRLCIFECGGNEESLDAIDIDKDLKELITKYLFLNITQNDEISTKICPNCLQRLKDFDEFSDFIKRRQNCLDAVYFKSENIDGLATISPLCIDYVNEEMNMEDILLERLEQNIGIELPEAMEFAEAFNDMITDVESDISVARPSKKQVCSKEDKSKHTNLQHTTAKFTQKNQKSEKVSKNMFVNKQSVKSDERDQFIEEHIQLKCKICRAVLDTFKNFQWHFRVKHNCPAYIKCCGSRYYSKQRIIKHIQSHVNPDLFKCHVCNKNLSSQKNLDSHIASFHTAKEELKNVCETCGDRFTTPFILRTHMIVHEEGNNYNCEICNKSFKHLRSVKRHKRLQHGEILNHVCELCGKNYKYKQIFEQHMADKHSIILKDTMKYCEECKVWFSAKYYQKHAERHELKDIDCSYCGKVYPSKAALNKHLDSHYHKKRCQLRDKLFNHSKELKEHMETHVN